MLLHLLLHALPNALLQYKAPAKDPPGPVDSLIFRVPAVAGSPALHLHSLLTHTLTSVTSPLAIFLS
jgi:hypothetical protein